MYRRRSRSFATLVTIALAVISTLLIPVAAQGQSETDTIQVRARSWTGAENMKLEVNGQVVASWDNVPTTMTSYIHHLNLGDGLDSLRILFDNDGRHNGRDKNLLVDYVEVNGQRFETESATTNSQGVWNRSTGCRQGYKRSELLACNGWLEYAIDGAVSPRPGENPETADCLVDGQHGYIKPLPGVCVGVPEGVRLTNFATGMHDRQVHTISANDVTIEGKRFLGCVVITGQNVTFRNNYVECYASRDINNSNSPYPGNNGPVNVTKTARRALVENNTLVCKKKHIDTAACDFGIYLRGPDSVARRNDIAGMVDGFDPGNRATIEYNYVHDFGLAYEEWRERAFPSERSHYSHADGVQIYQQNHGGVTIRGNYFEGLDAPGGPRQGGMQGILAQAPSGERDKPAIRIENNAFIGYWTSLRIACFSQADCWISQNVIDEKYQDSRWAVAVIGADPATAVVCNRFTNGLWVQSHNVIGGVAKNNGC